MPTAELNPPAPVEPPAPVKPRGSIAHGTCTSASDAALVRRMRAGDERSFETIFKRHSTPLLSYCRHMLASRDEAEDALQHTFIRAHTALLGESPPRELRPWLYAIARNCCLSAIAARRSTSELDERTPSLGGLSEEVHEREELRELVTDIAQLPEDQRSALLLSELDDLSHREIAGVVGCPVSKVKALVYQARTTLMAEREARGASCRDIREQLSVARGGALRRGPLRRHVRLCSGCHDFQLAVEAQRQSLALVLPVLPSAALAARILGHGTLHAAGAAGVGHAAAGVAPVGGSAAAGTSAAASGGTGFTAAGGAAAGTTATGATAVSGTSAGAWIGGGLLAKVAVGGTVAALATVGAVAVPHRLWHTSPRAAHGTPHGGPRSAFTAAARRGAAANTAFVSAGGLPQAGGPTVRTSPAESVQLDLSGLVSPATVPAAAAGLGGTTPGGSPLLASFHPSSPPGAGGTPTPPRGTLAAVAHRRSQARRAHLRTLRDRRLLKRKRLLKRRLSKRRLLLEKRRLLKRRRRTSSASPPAVAPAAATPRKPVRKIRTQSASGSTSSGAPATAGGTTAKRKARGSQAGATTGALPTSTGTTPATRRIGNGSTTSGPAGTAAGEPGGHGKRSATGASAGGPENTGAPSGGKSSGGRSSGAAGQAAGGTSGAETGSQAAGGKGAGGEESGPAPSKKTTSPGAGGSTGANGGAAHDRGGKPSPNGGGGVNTTGGLPEENLLDANRPSDQPLG